MGLYNYIKDNYPLIHTLDVYLEPVSDTYRFIKGVDQIRHSCDGGVSYDLSIGKYFVQLSNVQQSSSLSMEVRLAKPSFKFKVFYNGAQAQYKEENGSIVVKVPFENGKVEIKGV